MALQMDFNTDNIGNENILNTYQDTQTITEALLLLHV